MSQNATTKLFAERLEELTEFTKHKLMKWTLNIKHLENTLMIMPNVR